MTISRWLPVRMLALLTLMLLLAEAPPSLGQKAPPPVLPNPQAPTLGMVVPLGIQRGTTLDLTLTGTNLAEPTGLWTSFPATVTIPSENNNGKDNTKLKVHLEVPKDAPIGFHALRLATKSGISNLRLFCVDDLPQVMSDGKNRSKETAQTLPIPCVVVGRADAEMSDYYKIGVTAGQRVSFEILGRRLGSVFDPQITLLDGKTGREVPGGHSNDAPGLQTDPRLTYTFKQAGDVLIEVRDSLYRGGPDYWYRLRIGDFPCATAPIPMAAKRGSQVTVQFAGTMVDGVAPVPVTVPADPGVDTVWVTPRGASGLPGWPVALAVSDHEEGVEQEPNDEPGKANRIPVPGGITGRFEQKADRDHYVFPAKKGQRLVIEAHTLELYSPTEVYMVLKDASGKELAKSNPATAARLDFAPPADGDYTLAVEHLHQWGGPTEVYRITVTPVEPGFDLTLPIDRYDVPQGGATIINVQAVRRDYKGPIQLSLVGAPEVNGQAVIPAGQTSGQLILTAGPDSPLKPYSVRVQGKANIDGKPMSVDASVRAGLSQSLAGLPYPPRDLYRQVGLATAQKPPFVLTIKSDHAEVVRGLPTALTVTAERKDGFAEEIAVLPITGLPPTIPAPALKSIPKGKNEVKVPFTVPVKAPLGKFPLILSGKAKYQGKDYLVSSLPVSLEVALPFDLKVEGAPVKLAPGAKAKLQVTAVRKGGYPGPIRVELQKLPAGVTAAPAMIAEGKDSVELELAAAPTATIGDKADVNVLGVVSVAGVQTNATLDFTVSVQKK